ncbi:hypothetical protein FZEAL_688 [Fusarium zealandicum]|uniref:Uncharacterized protein n=1 Tax=Fusarium zealandicum TaxID=1053134 RepID=A0A8H4UU70_9HYPO|nr:hypothetical protein FZEAL_688 [Fusarium zealandicum]
MSFNPTSYDDSYPPSPPPSLASSTSSPVSCAANMSSASISTGSSTSLASFPSLNRAVALANSRERARCSALSPEAQALVGAVPVGVWLALIRDTGFGKNLGIAELDEADNKLRLNNWHIPAIHERYAIGGNHRCFDVNCIACMTKYACRYRDIRAYADQYTSKTLLDIEVARCPSNYAGNQAPGYQQEYLQRRMRHVTAGDTPTAEWLVKSKKTECAETFEKSVFLSRSPSLLVSFTLSETTENGYDELQKGYLAWRKIWHALVVKNNPGLAEGDMEIVSSLVHGVLPELRMWGNIQNDFSLYSLGHLNGTDICDLYNLGPNAIEYLCVHHVHWKDEVDIIEDFAGMKKEFHGDEAASLNKAALDVDRAIMSLVAAEGNLADSPCHGTQLQRDTAVYYARVQFQLLRDIVYSKRPVSTEQ